MKTNFLFLCALILSNLFSSPVSAQCTLHVTLTDSVSHVYPYQNSTTIYAIVTGAHGPFTRRWSDSSASYVSAISRDSRDSDIYSITVRDSLGCTASAFDTLRPRLCTLQMYQFDSIEGGIYDRMYPRIYGSQGTVQYEWTYFGTQLGAAQGHWAYSPSILTSAAHTDTAFILRVQDASGCYSSRLDTSHCAYTGYFQDSVDAAHNVRILIYHLMPGASIGRWSTDAYRTLNYVTLPINYSGVVSVEILGQYCRSHLSYDYSRRPVCSGFTTALSASFTGAYAYTLTASPTSGNAPYGYSWSGSTANTQIINVPVGIYTVTVSDLAGCTATASVTAGTPSSCTALTASVYDSVAGTAHILKVRLAGGWASPQYVWSTHYLTPTITASGPGQYCVTVTDHSGCARQICYTLSQAIFCQGYSVTNTVNYLSGGNIQVIAHPSTSTPLRSVLWNNGWTRDTLATTHGGIYCVTITDTAGCTASRCDTVAVHCSGFSTSITAANSGGASYLTAVPSGGVAPYMYIWDNGPTTRVDTVTTSGTYCVTVLDSNFCYANTCNTTTTNCNGYTASVSDQVSGVTHTLTVQPAGGTASTYHWSTGAATASISTTTAGSYCVTVTFSSGCTASACLSVTSACTGYSASVTHAVSGTTYTLNVATTGGTAASYHWSTGANTAAINTSLTGRYCVTVTSTLGCTATACDSVTAVCTGYSVSVTHAVSGTTYTLTVATTGGTAASYHWSTGANTAAINTSLTGRYCVTVTSTLGCTATACDSVTAVCTGYSASVTHAVSDTTYTLSAVTTGGTAASYHWSTGATTAAIITSLTGRYCVTVTSTLGCTATACDSVTAVCTGYSASVSDIATGSSHDLTAYTTSGTAASYLWSTGAATAVINVSSGGNYCVTITSTAGCTAVACDSVTMPACYVNAGFTLYQDTATPHHWYLLNTSAGAGPVQMSWDWGDGSALSTGDTPSHVYATSGTYYICATATDSTGCINTYCDSSYMYKTANDMVYINVVRSLPDQTHLGISSAETGNPELELYPNPSGGIVTLRMHDTTGYILDVTILDELGRAVYVSHDRLIDTAGIQLDLRGYANGIYTVVLSGKAVNARRQLILY